MHYEKKKLPDNIKAVIFDVDGTLVDSLDAWADSDRVFLEEYGVTYSRDISEKLKTMHFVSAAEYLKNEFDLPLTLDEVCERINGIIGYKYSHEIPAKEGVTEFIRECSRRGLPMCAATSNLKGLALAVLGNCGLMKDMQFVLTSDEIGSSKDDPEIFMECARRLDAAPQDTAVFEDSFHAAQAAASAGFYTVGVYDRHYAAEFEKLKEICTDTVMSMKEYCDEE